MSSIHFILQGKGGVGKTIISSTIAQFLLDSGQRVKCVNTDPINHSFSKYERLAVTTIPILKDNQLDLQQFDALIEMILESDQHFVIDNGASSFAPISHYLHSNDVVKMLEASGKKVIFHIPLVGGPGQADTLTGFDGIASAFEDVKIIVWENRHFGDIKADSKKLKDFKAFKKHETKVSAVIDFGEQKPLFTADFEAMHSKKLTFDEAVKSSEFRIMAKQRLKLTQREISEKITEALRAAGLEIKSGER